MPDEITTVLAGFDDTPQSTSGLRLAAMIAEATDSTLIVASVLEYDPVPLLPEQDHEEARQNHFRSIFESAREVAPMSDFEARELTGRPGRELYHGAIRLGADLLVLGSTHRGPLGRVYPGSVAHQLLHGAPCPIAVAPRDFEARSLKRLGLAFDGSDESWAALGFAATLARAAHARLALLTVLPTYLVVDGDMLTVGETERHYEEQLERARAVAGDVCGSSTLLANGDGPASVISAAADELDLLVVGSRGFGPIGRVVLGSVAAQLFRTATCPVIAVPRGSVRDSGGESDVRVATGEAQR